jgi:hypothetical protein
VDLVLDTATHNVLEEGETGGQPIPVYSPFLWLTSGTKDSAKPPAATRVSGTSLPVFDDSAVNSQAAGMPGNHHSSVSEQIVGLCKANEISDTDHRQVLIAFVDCVPIQKILQIKSDYRYGT